MESDMIKLYDKYLYDSKLDYVIVMALIGLMILTV